uniref:Uncharacterized protein n=1 Tax=Peronospora matthiolae TaxID=2874970 RepID=A0AAV1SZW8_9STRA
MSTNSSFVAAIVHSNDPAADDIDVSMREGLSSPALGVNTPTSSVTSSALPSSCFHKFIAAPSFLKAGVYLGGILVILVEKELIHGRAVRFSLQIRLNPVDMLQYLDEKCDRRVYKVQDEIVTGNLPVPEEDLSCT